MHHPTATRPCQLTRRACLIGVGATAVAPHAPATAQPALPVSARALIDAATAQIGVTVVYDAAYVALAFPGGDVPPDRGVCTDVIVRAYRRAFGFDLQAAVNADMKSAFAAYPRHWGLSRPDPNIDHRRVPNLQVFLTRRGAAIPRPHSLTDWQPGDIVSQMIPGGRPHIGIVSDKVASGSGRHLVLHNIGRGTQADDVLAAFPITGRYQFWPKFR